ncbi:MAG: hypothetical protein K2Y32_07645 [Candidatus Obscuribacterales bacterium]|nr:hypothetical protein [Candidatus Obscuribacterales bacterium]
MNTDLFDTGKIAAELSDLSLASKHYETKLFGKHYFKSASGALWADCADIGGKPPFVFRVMNENSIVVESDSKQINANFDPSHNIVCSHSDCKRLEPQCSVFLTASIRANFDIKPMAPGKAEGLA